MCVSVYTRPVFPLLINCVTYIIFSARSIIATFSLPNVFQTKLSEKEEQLGRNSPPAHYSKYWFRQFGRKFQNSIQKTDLMYNCQ